MLPILVDVDTEMPVVAALVVFVVREPSLSARPSPPDAVLPAKVCEWPGSLTDDVDVAVWL